MPASATHMSYSPWCRNKQSRQGVVLGIEKALGRTGSTYTCEDIYGNNVLDNISRVFQNHPKILAVQNEHMLRTTRL